MKKQIPKLERLLELGGVKKDIACLVASGAAILCSLAGLSPFPFDVAWVAIILCGIPIIMEAVIGLVTESDMSDDDVYRFCAAAEQLSEHPLGKAIVKSYQAETGISLPSCEQFVMLPGRGVFAVACGKQVFAGNLELMADKNVLAAGETFTETEIYLKQGCTGIMKRQLLRLPDGFRSGRFMPDAARRTN